MNRASILTVIATLSSCSPGVVAEKARPEQPRVTASQALGATEAEATCRPGAPSAEPLVVDMGAELRGELELAMKRGLAVVSWDCKALKVLPECAIDGTYGFLGMTTKEQLVRLENDSELKANLSLGGGTLSAQLGGALERGSAIDVALVLIGRKTSTWRSAERADLRGSCQGATHFVRGATVGAFVLETAAKAVVRTVAQAFSAGAAARDASSQKVRQQDGVLDECRKASPEAAAPPAQCAALLRVELTAIAAAAAPRTADATAPCAEGLVFADGKCTTPSAAGAHLCKAGDLDGCTTQCGKGHADSCFRLAWLYENGTDRAGRDEARAVTLYKQACEGGSAAGCRGLGVLHGRGKAVPLDHGRAVALFGKACSGGDAAGCANLGVMHEAGWGVTRDDARALALYKQACDGGDASGCNHLGRCYAGGLGVGKDALRAAALYKQACDGDDADGCSKLGWLYATGSGVPREEPRAATLFGQACDRGDANGCASLGWMQYYGRGVARETQRGLELLKRGCHAGNPWGCQRLKEIGASP